MEKYIEIITKNMGSCWCGHCYCKVYEDGSIRYTGQENWQKSERKAPDFAERRSYGSTIKEADYKAAMKKMASPEFRAGYAEYGYAATSNDCSYTWREGEE